MRHELEHLLNVKSDGHVLGLPKDVLRSAFEAVKTNAQTGIGMAALEGTAEARIHAALVETRVRAHFHRTPEKCSIYDKSGRLYLAEILHEGEHPILGAVQSLWVKRGDSFTIPGHYAHQLVNSPFEHGALKLLFQCPDSHLTHEDRIFVPDLAPGHF